MPDVVAEQPDIEEEPVAPEEAEVVDWPKVASDLTTRFEAPKPTSTELVREFINGRGRDRRPRRTFVADAAEVPPVPPVPAGPTLSPYREWTTRPVTPVEQASSSEVLDALVEIVTAEGPTHAEWAYRRYIKASGKERLRPNVKTTFNRLMYEAVRRGRLLQIKDDVVGQIGRTVYAPGSDPVVVRELGPRSLEDLPCCEVRAVAKALGLGGRSRVDVKRAMLAAYGRTNLTKSADKYLDEAFDYPAVTM